MAYASQMMLMRRKAAEDGMDVKVIHADYRDALLRLQKGENASTTSFDAQQYVAEHQTWSLNWPEIAFPGLDPRDLPQLAALTPLTSFQPSQPPQQESCQSPPSKRPRIARPISSQFSTSPSYPAIALAQRNRNKRSNERHRRPKIKTQAPEPPLKSTRCDDCGGEHSVRVCTQRFAFQDDPMQLDQQTSFDSAEAGQSLFLPREVTNSNTNTSTDKLQMTSADIHGVQALLDILKNCDAQRTSTLSAMQKVDTATTLDQEHRLPIVRNHPQKATVASMSTVAFGGGAGPNERTKKTFPTSMGLFAGHGNHTTSSNDGIFRAMSLPKRPPEPSIPSNHPGRLKYPGNAYEVHTPSSFLIPNSANTASVSYSQRQRKEFDKPPSPVRTSTPPLDAPIQCGPLTVPQPGPVRKPIPQLSGMQTGAPAVPPPRFSFKLPSPRKPSGRSTVPPPSLFRQPTRPLGARTQTSPLTVPPPVKQIPLPSSAPRPSDLPTEPTPALVTTHSSPISAQIPWDTLFVSPPTAVKKRSRPSSSRRQPRPLNIPQMLYASKTPKMPTLSGCANCKQPGHQVKDCEELCGLCDRARHTGGECTFRLR